jgi:hypothetical protein
MLFLMKKSIFLILVLPLFLLACEKAPYSAGALDSDILFLMAETLDGGPRSLQFHCRTGKIYPCSNYGIAHSLKKRSQTIGINFSHVILHDFCLTALGPATTIIDIGSLNEGHYALEVSVGHDRSLGQLTVTEEYYQLDFVERSRLQPQVHRLNRVPENTIWGRVGYHDEATANLVQSFLDSLHAAGASHGQFAPGNYGHFTIDGEGEIVPPTNHGYYFIRPFVMLWEGDTQAIKELVASFGSQYDHKMKILLQTSRGEAFRSWVQ